MHQLSPHQRCNGPYHAYILCESMSIYLQYILVHLKYLHNHGKEDVISQYISPKSNLYNNRANNIKLNIILNKGRQIHTIQLCTSIITVITIYYTLYTVHVNIYDEPMMI